MLGIQTESKWCCRWVGGGGGGTVSFKILIVNVIFNKILQKLINFSYLLFHNNKIINLNSMSLINSHYASLAILLSHYFKKGFRLYPIITTTL